MKPKWLRNNYACPACGKTFEIEELGKIMYPTKKGHKPFDCPRCGVHYTKAEFDYENAFKWGYDEESERP